jgi:DNA-binding NarL/FixJ family response regulator
LGDYPITEDLIRVLVADADVATRRGIRLLLERSGFLVCAEAGDAEAAVAAAVRERPALCLVDAGIPAIDRIKSRVPETTVVVFVAEVDEDELVEALRAGASGYLPKNVDPAGLVRALHAAVRGEPALPRSLLAPVVEAFRGRERRRRVNVPGRAAIELTPREAEVLELLRDDLSTAEIANRLDISPITVRRHVGTVLGKLRVPDRAAALRLLKRSDG